MDLIEKQDAIDAVAELVSSMSVCISIDECHGMKRMQGMAVRALEELPSAQPDGWLEQNKDKILQAGMEGREVEFRIGGRLFAIREMAQ